MSTARLRGLAHDIRATAAIEFALVAPVMILLLFGTIDVVNAFRVQAKLNTAAGQLAELIASQQAVTAPTGTLSDICLGASLNMAPFTTSTLSADVASVSNDHPANRVSGSKDTTSVASYLDWENRTICSGAVSGSLGLNGAFALANAPTSLLTKTAASASSTTDTALAYGFSAIVVRATYSYTNALSFVLGKTLRFSAVAVARPRTNVTINCTNAAGTAACPALQ